MTFVCKAVVYCVLTVYSNDGGGGFAVNQSKLCK